VNAAPFSLGSLRWSFYCSGEGEVRMEGFDTNGMQLNVVGFGKMLVDLASELC